MYYEIVPRVQCDTVFILTAIKKSNHTNYTPLQGTSLYFYICAKHLDCGQHLQIGFLK